MLFCHYRIGSFIIMSVYRHSWTYELFFEHLLPFVHRVVFCLRVSEMVYQYRLHRIHFHHEIHLLIYIYILPAFGLVAHTKITIFSRDILMSRPCICFLWAWTISSYIHIFWYSCYSCSILPIALTVLQCFSKSCPIGSKYCNCQIDLLICVHIIVEPYYYHMVHVVCFCWCLWFRFAYHVK